MMCGCAAINLIGGASPKPCNFSLLVQRKVTKRKDTLRTRRPLGGPLCFSPTRGAPEGPSWPDWRGRVSVHAPYGPVPRWLRCSALPKGAESQLQHLKPLRGVFHCVNPAAAEGVDVSSRRQRREPLAEWRGRWVPFLFASFLWACKEKRSGCGDGIPAFN